MRVFADGRSPERDWKNAFRPALGSTSLLTSALMSGVSRASTIGAAGTQGWGAWVDGYGAFGKVDASQNAPGFDYSIGGLATGAGDCDPSPSMPKGCRTVR